MYAGVTRKYALTAFKLYRDKLLKWGKGELELSKKEVVEGLDRYIVAVPVLGFYYGDNLKLWRKEAEAFNDTLYLSFTFAAGIAWIAFIAAVCIITGDLLSFPVLLIFGRFIGFPFMLGHHEAVAHMSQTMITILVSGSIGLCGIGRWFVTGTYNVLSGFKLYSPRVVNKVHQPLKVVAFGFVCYWLYKFYPVATEYRAFSWIEFTAYLFVVNATFFFLYQSLDFHRNLRMQSTMEKDPTVIRNALFKYDIEFYRYVIPKFRETYPDMFEEVCHSWVEHWKRGMPKNSEFRLHPKNKLPLFDVGGFNDKPKEEKAMIREKFKDAMNKGCDYMIDVLSVADLELVFVEPLAGYVIDDSLRGYSFYDAYWFKLDEDTYVRFKGAYILNSEKEYMWWESLMAHSEIHNRRSLEFTMQRCASEDYLKRRALYLLKEAQQNAIYQRTRKAADEVINKAVELVFKNRIVPPGIENKLKELKGKVEIPLKLETQEQPEPESKVKEDSKPLECGGSDELRKQWFEEFEKTSKLFNL
jgi:hypothetical protein